MIAPAAIISGVLILQRCPFGYILAFVRLVLEWPRAPVIVLQTVDQLDVGVDLSSGEAITPIAGFTDIALCAVGVIVLLLRNIADAQHAANAEVVQGGG